MASIIASLLMATGKSALRLVISAAHVTVKVLGIYFFWYVAMYVIAAFGAVSMEMAPAAAVVAGTFSVYMLAEVLFFRRPTYPQLTVNRP